MTLAARIFKAMVFLTVALSIGTASAGPIESAYTKIRIDACQKLSEHEMGATWKCPGFENIPVIVAESDLRFFVSYGENGDEEKAFRFTPIYFNHINETLEWRYESKGGKRVPFATILRFFLDREGKKPGQVLIVTTLGPNGVCHVAYIDARARKNANQLAREIADTKARSFDCNRDAALYGRPGADETGFWDTAVQ